VAACHRGWAVQAAWGFSNIVVSEKEEFTAETLRVKSSVFLTAPAARLKIKIFPLRFSVSAVRMFLMLFCAFPELF
jgi:hypothetical protein